MIILIIIVIAIIVVAVVSAGKKEHKAKKVGEKLENVIQSGHLMHGSGLPGVPGNAELFGYVLHDELVFIKDSQEFSIKRENIISVDSVAGKEFSAGGAAVGYLAFGLVGAALGASTTYMVITFKSNDETKAVAFVDFKNKLCDEIKRIGKEQATNTSTERIEL